MKGTIAKCIGEMVATQYGKETWETILENAGLSKATVFWPALNVDEDLLIKVLTAACMNMRMTFEDAADRFGDYWMNDYAPRTYPQYFTENMTARDFVLSLDRVHQEMARTTDKVPPPRFEYEWENDRTLILHYRSQRGILALAVGLIKGVEKHFGEKLEVTRLRADRLKIVFA